MLAEKPVGPDVATEWQLVHEIEDSDRLVAVNLFNRGTPEEMQEILEHRRNLVNGFGLPIKTQDLRESQLVQG